MNQASFVAPPGAAVPKPVTWDHKAYVQQLQGEARLAAWKEFSENYWKTKSGGTPGEKNEFLFRRGFYRNRWWLYGLGREDAANYLSDIQVCLLPAVNGVYANVANDRLLLNHALSAYCRVPVIHALRGLGAAEVSFSEEWEAHRAGSNDAPDMQVVIQPLPVSVQGRTETVSLAKGEFSGFGKHGPLKQLRHIVKDWSLAANSAYLFSEALVQGRFARQMFPGAVNRLHVLMGRHHDSWEPHIVAAVLCIGTLSSASRTSLEAGGLSARVDTHTGELTACVGLLEGPKLGRHDVHPDTGTPIVGSRVPQWDSIRASLLRIFDESSYLRVCAFDFVLMDGELGLLGAALPDVVAIQVHRPLLADAVFADQLRRLKL
ncbi:hypothetical protein CAI21_13875 [Alkalilimnicola ehrlichii]|uniref:Alpha-L-glutamate ligase-related protein ATP-grasp domain-containing protein n=1 Tax=Alkalilimnicola ehrlichii TaxID=351052 RepID=A0A3E0WNU9_9GAMM|nr:sugar-transfer associated ATP-grasp domain-containing protein [Alkalilimnicola ehrlichii]RFA27999.1 hypothetical protein CAI21_13875 [Alkalilimnicola ehrlichii]RFA34650.1 hypothetical protein CAL65_14915 [Alkalilimnicola ehrlichii]